MDRTPFLKSFVQEQSLQSWSSTHEELNFRLTLRKFLNVFCYLSIHTLSSTRGLPLTRGAAAAVGDRQRPFMYSFLIISLTLHSGREEMSTARSSGSCTGGAACVRQGQQTRLLQNLFKDRWKPLLPLPGEVPAAEQCPSRQPPGIPGLPPAWRALSHAWRIRTRAVNDTPGPFRL